ncbi:hypothetical protein [Streptomyces spongiae]|uniref:Lipoprotein CseA n=1 Tax=Streptomyces spongiae TaxID=565072 RepID=A0A5N8XXG2_9ACTN|nr:hypothetical protein [Streptomyces spongiae]MPY63946.1 hypothetical protein [Streptomyces spongiae]
MRGLSNRPGPDGPSHAQKAVITAGAMITALGLFVAACGTGGTGARDEGPADNDSLAQGAASPTATATEDRDSMAKVVKLVKADPKVSKEVKRDLQPCVADEYPVDVSYGKLTGASANDIVVNVMTCSDAVGVASYVFRERRSGYENVFRAEEPPVYAEIDRGELVVTQQLYAKGDPVEFPSSEEVITYRWAKHRFTEQSRTHNDYSNAVGDTDTPEPVPAN